MNGENVLKFIDKNIAINKSIGMVGGIDLMALKNELVEIIEKADKWDEKEAPYVIQEYYSDGRTKQGFCKCDAVVRESETYCWSCGRMITFERGE